MGNHITPAECEPAALTRGIFHLTFEHFFVRTGPLLFILNRWRGASKHHLSSVAFIQSSLVHNLRRGIFGWPNKSRFKHRTSDGLFFDKNNQIDGRTMSAAKCAKRRNHGKCVRKGIRRTSLAPCIRPAAKAVMFKVSRHSWTNGNWNRLRWAHFFSGKMSMRTVLRCQKCSAFSFVHYTILFRFKQRITKAECSSEKKFRTRECIYPQS